MLHLSCSSSMLKIIIEIICCAVLYQFLIRIGRGLFGLYELDHIKLYLMPLSEISIFLISDELAGDNTSIKKINLWCIEWHDTIETSIVLHREVVVDKIQSFTPVYLLWRGDIPFFDYTFWCDRSLEFINTTLTITLFILFYINQVALTPYYFLIYGLIIVFILIYRKDIYKGVL